MRGRAPAPRGSGQSWCRWPRSPRSRPRAWPPAPGAAAGNTQEQATGAGTAAALTVHRFLEGAAIALASSAVVALALAVHAFGEGLATGALLGGQAAP